MLVEAKSKYIRIAPRKVRMVADLIRGMKVEEAEKVLQFAVKRSTNPVLKVLRSAVANAEHNFNMKKEDLYIAEIRIDGGPIIKRFRPRARGSASAIQKKTSHISIKLSSTTDSKEKVKKVKKIKTVYQEEKPKEEGVKRKQKPTQDQTLKEKTKEVKGDKKQVFRRKSI